MLKSGAPITIVLVIFLLIIPAPARAEYRRGFHEGPYLRIVGGMISSTFDDNARTGEKVANNHEGVYGFQFGWNLWDAAAPELEVRYATKPVRNSREHIFNVNMNMRYSFVTKALTGIAGTLNILPFVQGGPACMIAAVPGDRDTADRLLTVWGLGLGGGAGIDFLFYQYVYLGVLFQTDLLYIPPVHQYVGGARSRIIAGGSEPFYSVIGMAGVHF